MMHDKPQLAVGLDLGSSSTRCLILRLEAGRLRYAGHSEVPSDGWSKGRSSGSAGRDRRVSARPCARPRRKRESPWIRLVVGIGGIAASKAATAGAFMNSAGRAR